MNPLRMVRLVDGSCIMTFLHYTDATTVMIFTEFESKGFKLSRDVDNPIFEGIGPSEHGKYFVEL